MSGIGPDNPQRLHWLVRPHTIRRLWWGGAAVLVVTLLLQALAPYKGVLAMEGWPACAAVFGFAACVVLVLAAKVLGEILKRPEDYFGGDRDDA